VWWLSFLLDEGWLWAVGCAHIVHIVIVASFFSELAREKVSKLSRRESNIKLKSHDVKNSAKSLMI
jgi:hypothetical protein